MRQRALELFNEKVEEQKTLQEKKKAGDEGLANSTKLFLDMVPKLTNIIKDKDMVRPPPLRPFAFCVDQSPKQCLACRPKT
jgi:hypothetical protein